MSRRLMCPRSVLVLVVLAVATSGCGGDGDTASSTGPASTVPRTDHVTTSSPPETTPPTGAGGSSTRVTISTTVAGTPADAPVNVDSVPEKVNVSVSTGKTQINGVTYTNSLILEPSAYSTPNRVEINAGRSRTRFLGDLGIPDDESSSSAYKVDISLDNAAAAYSTEVRFGETKKLDLDVKDVLRIKITISPVSPDSSGRCCAALAIGEPRFR